MKVKYKNKSIEIKAKKIQGFSRFIGLMFKKRNTKILLFEDVKTIHSLFVFFRFLAVWLNEKNKVVDFKLVKPFNFAVSSDTPSAKLLEIPLNNKNKNILDFFVGKGKV